MIISKDTGKAFEKNPAYIPDKNSQQTKNCN